MPSLLSPCEGPTKSTQYPYMYIFVSFEAPCGKLQLCSLCKQGNFALKIAIRNQ